MWDNLWSVSISLIADTCCREELHCLVFLVASQFISFGTTVLLFVRTICRDVHYVNLFLCMFLKLGKLTKVDLAQHVVLLQPTLRVL